MTTTIEPGRKYRITERHDSGYTVIHEGVVDALVAGGSIVWMNQRTKIAHAKSQAGIKVTVEAL